MKLKHKEEMNFEAMSELINQKLPQYTTTVKKNPVAKFQYIEVKKSGLVGVWIRVFEKKGRVQLMNAVPSTVARALFFGLILVAFTYGSQSKVRKEVGAILKEAYGTEEL